MTSTVRKFKPTAAQYDYLRAVSLHEWFHPVVGTELACIDRGWVTVERDPEDAYRRVRTVTEAGREILAAGRPELSEKARRTKTQRTAENAVVKMINTPGVDVAMLAETLGTSISRLLDLCDAARTRGSR